MPSVRYGPDITDDAAKTMNRITDLQRTANKKTGKLTKRNQAALNKQKKIAQRLFGVSSRDIDKKKFGLMKDLAKYSSQGKDARGRRYKRGKFAKKTSLKRDKLGRKMRDRKTKKLRTESRIRAKNVIKSSRKDSLNQVERRIARGDKKFGGASQLGRTTPKGLQKAFDQFDRINARKGRASNEGRSVSKIRPLSAGGREDVSKLFSKRNDNDRGRIVKPKKSKAAASKKRNKSQQNKRKKAIKAGGKKSTKAKKVTKPKKATKSKKR